MENKIEEKKIILFEDRIAIFINDDYKIKVWDVKTGENLKNLEKELNNHIAKIMVEKYGDLILQVIDNIIKNMKVIIDGR